MTPSNTVHKPLKIYIDANLAKQFAQSLNILQSHLNKSEKKNIEVYSISNEFGDGIKDVEIFEKLKNCNSIILTFDRKIQKTKLERETYLQNNIGVLFLKNKDSDFWNTYKHIIKHWDEIKSICRKNKSPFSFRQPGQNKRFVNWMND